MGHVVGIVIHKSACTHGECGEQGAVIVDSCEIDAEIVGKLSARLSMLFGVVIPWNISRPLRNTEPGITIS